MKTRDTTLHCRAFERYDVMIVRHFVLPICSNNVHSSVVMVERHQDQDNLRWVAGHFDPTPSGSRHAFAWSSGR